MTGAVYQTGPLKGLPIRGGEPPISIEVIEPFRWSRTPVSPHDVTQLDPPPLVWVAATGGTGKSAMPPEARRLFGADAYPGDPILTDETIDNAGGVDVEWTEAPDLEGGVTGLAGLVFAALTVAYFGLRILGVFG